MIIQYTLPAATDLEMALATVREIHSECGLTPEFLQLPDGTRVVYDRADFRRLERGELHRDEYIDKNTLHTDVFSD